MRQARVCMVTIEYPPEPGGVGRSVQRIAAMLRQAGYEVHVVVFHAQRVTAQSDYGNHRGFDYSEQDGVHVYRSRAVVKTATNSVPEFLSDVAMELKQLHQRLRFDLFHAFFMNETGFLTTLVAREAGVPVICSVRGSDLHKNVFNARHFPQLQWSLANASWATFVSRELEHRAHVLVPEIAARTSAFWNSVEPVDFSALAPPSRQRELRGLVVGSAGRFRDKKGADYLIRACAMISGEVDLTLVLVGDFVEKEKPYWDNFVRASGIGERIIVTGLLPHEEALRYYPRLDVFAIPSLRDGCPNSLLEAMLAGRAVVGTRTDAIGEIIQDGVNGLSVEAGSAEALAAALRRLAASPELRQRLGRAARTTALTALSPQVERDNWLRIYDQVLHGAPARSTARAAAAVSP